MSQASFFSSHSSAPSFAPSPSSFSSSPTTSYPYRQHSQPSSSPPKVPFESSKSFSSSPPPSPPRHTTTIASPTHSCSSSSISSSISSNCSDKSSNSNLQPNLTMTMTSSGDSTASSSSASSATSNPTSSDALRRGIEGESSSSGGRTRMASTTRSEGGTSVASLATTVSPGPEEPSKGPILHEEEGEKVAMEIERNEEEGGGEVRMDEDKPEETRQSSETAGGVDLSALSIRQQGEEEEEEEGGNDNDEAIAEGEDGNLRPPGSAGKTRRASVLSSNSVKTPQPGEGGADEQSKSGKRKMARMGSFHDQGSSSASNATPSGSGLPTPQPPTPQAIELETSGPNTSSASENHVDIVSYPSNDLLRLLASLLEQIAQANDARNARVAAAAAAAAAAANPSTSPASSTTSRPAGAASGAATPSTPSTRRNSLAKNGGEDDASFGKGRFDAAPLNSPVTPHHVRRFPKIGGAGGPGILDNALDEDTSAFGDEEDDEMPLTPGVDLLREVGEGGGVEGFMPSLGGTHQPMPLGRRRGSSFVRNKRPDEASIRPSASRSSTGGGTGSSFRMARKSSSSSNETSTKPSSSSTLTPNATSPAPMSTSPNSTTPPTSSSSEPPLTALFSASSIALSSPNATLCFHARNVPAISIESYLLRILKYCPTTNEVFLALLVYFDRMARIGLEAQRLGLPKESPEAAQDATGEGATSASQASKLFAIDSFNVHRLVIAGVTVASKFFSDVFYTNSRYAKVGGLPLHELNQLELQFLLLNDFRLKIPTDELQRYADQLILFWIGRNGTSNPPAAAAAQAAAASSTTSSATNSPKSRSTASLPSSSQGQAPRVPTPTHAPNPSDAHSMRPPARLTHSAVAAHSTTSSPVHPHSTSSFTTSSTSSARNSQHPLAGMGYSNASASTSSTTRPRSIRSQPSSSGTSVASTITPGTPSTTRGRRGSSSSAEDDYERSDDDENDQQVRARGRNHQYRQTTSTRFDRKVVVEPSEDGHYHDGWSSNEASSRDSSAERDERDRMDVDRRVRSKMEED